MEPQGPQKISDNFAYRYSSFATPKCYWENHKHKEAIKTKQFTIVQRLESTLKGNQLFFRIACVAGFPIESTFISDYYNEGTYADTLCYSFKSLNKDKNTLLADSHFATKTKRVGIQLGTQTGNNPGMVLGPIPNVNTAFASTAIQNCNTDTDEFETQVFPPAEEGNLLKTDLTLCYDDATRRNAVSYDVNKLSSLRCCNHATRVKIGLTPYGWFGGWQSCPDTVYKVPKSAKTSVGTEWSFSYDIKDFSDLEFEWSTEARTVFASNDWDVNLQNKCGDYLNWIKTVHKITHTIRINVNKDRIPSIEVTKRNIKVVSASGYEDQMIHGDLLINRDVDESKNNIQLYDTFHNSLSMGIKKDDLDKMKINVLK